jgi:hypothetical protein
VVLKLLEIFERTEMFEFESGATLPQCPSLEDLARDSFSNF